MAGVLDPDHGTAAHKARLTAGIQRVVPQVRDSGGAAEFPDKSGLAVEGGVMPGVDLIFVGKNNFAILYQYGAEGLVAVLCGRLG